MGIDAWGWSKPILVLTIKKGRILQGVGFNQFAIGSMYAIYIYIVTWIPSIYPLYVSINIPAPWIRHGLAFRMLHQRWQVKASIWRTGIGSPQVELEPLYYHLVMTNIANWKIPKKWRLFAWKSIYKRAIFNSYVSLPEGRLFRIFLQIDGSESFCRFS